MPSSDFYNKYVAITKSDTVNYDGSTFAANAATKALPADAIYVGGAGIVVAVMEDGSTAQFTAVAGEILPIRSIRVNSTTTTATLIGRAVRDLAMRPPGSGAGGGKGKGVGKGK
jgi:hypothetical protein